MKYMEIIKSGAKKIARDCWRGMWIENGMVCYVHSDKPGINKTPFKIIEAEKHADDWHSMDGEGE